MIHGRFISVAAIVAISFSILAISTTQAQAAAAEAVPGEYLVKIKPGFATRSLSQISGAEEVRVVSKERGVMLVKINPLIKPDYAFATLQKAVNYEIVEPNYLYHIAAVPNDPDLGKLWGLNNDGSNNGRAGVDIGAEQAWDIETGSDKVVVAVIDTGIDYTHPDLQGNIWVNELEKNGQAGVDDDGNGYVDDIYGYDFANNDVDPMDDHGHGTHCSGTIGARGNDGTGIVGVNWNVKLMALKFLTSKGSGTLENAVKAIDYATAKGVDVMSNSWGGSTSSALLEEAIQNAQKKGILFVAAAGNDGSNNDLLATYPASYDVDNILVVGAIDNTGQLASFSNYGTKSVQVAAPGVNIYSSIPGGHDAWNGTSMATPHVSGVAALLKAHEPGLTYLELKQRLIDTARPLAGLRKKITSMGVVNAYYALTNTKAPADPLDPFNWPNAPKTLSTAHPYAPNVRDSYSVTLPGAQRVSAYFDKFQTETQYDLVTFKDATGKVVGTWSGVHDGEFSPAAEGDTLYIEMSSDNTVQKYGFDITKVANQ